MSFANDIKILGMSRRGHTILPTRDKVKNSSTSEAGLEAPEELFVMLKDYEAEHGPADPSDIVVEEVDGVVTQGVNVRTGKFGWHRRM